MKLTFDDGSSVVVPADVQEMDMVTVSDRQGNKSKTSWGSVIAHTHGEALTLFEAQQPKGWKNVLNDRIQGDMRG